MAKRITRKLVERFLVQKKLHNIVRFLRYIAQPIQGKTFVNYAHRYGYRAQRSENITSNLLFHGSQHYSERLSPTSKKRCMYATNDPNYAIFLAILNLKNAKAGVVIKKGKINLTIDLAFVNGQSSLGTGWVHIVSAHHFKKTSNREYVSKQTVDVLFSIPVIPSDLTVQIGVEETATE